MEDKTNRLLRLSKGWARPEVKVSVAKEKEFRDFDKQLINTAPLKTGSIVALLDSYSTTLQILLGSHNGWTKNYLNSLRFRLPLTTWSMSLPGVPTTISRPLSIASAAKVNITKNKLVTLSYNYCPSKQDNNILMISNIHTHVHVIISYQLVILSSLNCNQSIKVNEEFGHHLWF